MANLAQRAAQSPIHTFTLAFEEQEFNEAPISRQIAAAIGTQHHEVVLTDLTSSRISRRRWTAWTNRRSTA